MQRKEKGRMRTILGFCSGSLRLNGSKVEKSPSQPLRFTTSQICSLLPMNAIANFKTNIHAKRKIILTIGQWL